MVDGMSRSEEKISVVVLSYNQEDLIEETVISVLDQDHPNFEVVVADDGSTDSSPTKLKELQKRYPDKLRLVLNESNGGVTKNCNSALRAASGGLIATVGGDDICLPGKIKKQARVFANNPDVAICFHPVEVFESRSGRTLRYTNQTRKEDSFSTREIIIKGSCMASPSIMVRRTAIPRGGFDERLPVMSDWLFNIEVSLAGQIAKVDEVLLRYRRHSGSISWKTYHMFDEAMETLRLAVEKHPEIPEMKEWCRIGRARYLAGEAVRQLEVDIPLARQLIKEAVEEEPGNINYRLFHFVALLPKPAALLAGKLFARIKFFLKRVIS